MPPLAIMEVSPDLANKRLVILGCGYVGTAVARLARPAGLRVEALTRNPARAAELDKLGVKAVVADLGTEYWHERIAPGADLVLNCVSSGGSSLDSYRRSYVEGMRSLLAWAGRGAVGTLVYTSSTSVYPQEGGMIEETAPTTGAGDTAQILLEAEDLLRASGAGIGRWFILRLAGIYGPGRHHLLDQLRLGANELAGSGDHRLNLVHQGDIVAAIFAAFGAPTAAGNQIFNVADDAPAPKSEVVRWLAERLGRSPPRFAGGAASTRRGFAAPPDRVISNGKIKATLGWRPEYPSFREGYAAILSA